MKSFAVVSSMNRPPKQVTATTRRTAGQDRRRIKHARLRNTFDQPNQCLAPPGLRVESTVVLMGTTPSLSSVENAANGNESINAGHQNRLDRSREMTRNDWTSVPDKRWSSRVLHNIGTVSEHAAAGLVAGSALVVWVAVGIAAEFPPWWENVLYIASSSVTVVMVFAIQHTQARQQAVT
ncbi:hypothetical protein QN355_19715 [Cryobacterium sp. 10S3]|uniref:hypothetical protein n=1 Tax=unclassified Cryobacterium TaxID=2649013 RepID=UPI002AB5547C|nr:MULTISPECIES: hypothetical protein [unclassified Cryobacterium]MDY7540822.1 hypothetical protein [Cryobacterium sp. 5B3]MEB0000220.1 hypothetical protein [Cryobacterium sp. RTS3]MEB0267063.1 hypothetical protein [Cryobacterium sp. 10I5]MEB0275777.1 hypothetical protein [Cryobacterium sp. 5B3]MEB0288759.1 hypothetical protein [Cryobacterium sp. 10S3]